MMLFAARWPWLLFSAAPGALYVLLNSGRFLLKAIQAHSQTNRALAFLAHALTAMHFGVCLKKEAIALTAQPPIESRTVTDREARVYGEDLEPPRGGASRPT